MYDQSIESTSKQILETKRITLNRIESTRLDSNEIKSIITAETLKCLDKQVYLSQSSV